MEERPLTARSIVASVLLGTRPPELSGQRLVRAAELFGQPEGTTRVALSRMVAAGELEAAGGRYRLAGPLLARYDRQDESRHPTPLPWDGSWRLAIVDPVPRPPAERAELRRRLGRLRLAEWRQGVWARPANLPFVAAGECVWLTARPDDPGTDRELVESLWDLPAWSRRADQLRAQMAETVGALEAGQTEALAPCFVIAAATVRHVQSDPLLPDELVPDPWPGRAVRAEYDAYEGAYQRLLRTWLAGHTASRPAVGRDG